MFYYKMKDSSLLFHIFTKVSNIYGSIFKITSSENLERADHDYRYKYILPYVADDVVGRKWQTVLPPLIESAQQLIEYWHTVDHQAMGIQNNLKLNCGWLFMHKICFEL